ncbi:MAG: histidinol dehydrogenase, partial [Clostridium sp.]|nr:histidinol dehydrogenase [Clostridium sp.]
NENYITEKVKEIITNVRINGDKALRYYSIKFEDVDLMKFSVSKDEIEEAYSLVDEKIICALKASKENIESYHMLQRNRGYLYSKDLGVYMGQRIIPLDSVGVYVPGGKAAYPSSVLMNIIPAKVAGVKNIIMVTPPKSDGKINKNILAAAKIAGVDKIFKIGGAQAIAALAYGTESIPKVLKIVGPGNAYVAEAKRMVFGVVDIDMIAGPSEILVIADEKANAKFIAADLISQAEHDERASSILLTTSIKLAKQVIKEVFIQINDFDKKDIISKSLSNYGKVIVCNSIKRAIDIANEIAPEHLELMITNPMEYLESIKNAASVFLGEYTPEPVGDYFAGTNHVLPTGGTAKFSSPLSVEDFVKKSSYIYYSKAALDRDGEKIMAIAEQEGLMAHKNSIKVRCTDEEDK